MGSQEQLSLTTYASRSSSISGYLSADMERRTSQNSVFDSADSELPKLEPQQSRWLTVAPMVAAILPAAITLVVDEAAGSLLADVIFLMTIGYAVWGLSNGAWSVLAHCTSIDKDRTPMFVAGPLKASSSSTAIRKPLKTRRPTNAINNQPEEPIADNSMEPLPVNSPSFQTIFALLIYLATPLVGGGTLYLARNHFNTGSMLMTNFNILLYTSLESLRTIHQAFHILVAGRPHVNRLAGRRPPEFGGESGGLPQPCAAETIAMKRAIQELQAKMIEQMEVARHAEIQIDSLSQELVSVGRRIFENETTVQSSVMTIYKEFESISLDIKELNVIVKKLRRSMSGEDPTPGTARLMSHKSYNDLQSPARKNSNSGQSQAIVTQQNTQQARQGQTAALSPAKQRTSSSSSKPDKAPRPSMAEMNMVRDSISKRYFTSILCWPINALKGIFSAFYKLIRWIIQ